MNTIVVATKEWSQGTIEGKMGYGTLPYLFDSVFGIGSGGVWEPEAFLPIDHATYSVTSGTAAHAYGYKGVYANTLGLHWSRDDNKVDGEVMGQEEIQGVALAGSLEEVLLRPVVPQTTSVWSADSFAELASGATKIAGDAFAADVELQGLLEPVYPLDPDYFSYAGTVEAKPQLTAKFQVAAKVGGGDYAVLPFTMANWRQGTRIFLRIQSTQTVDGVTYLLTLDMSLQILKPPQHNAIGNLYVAEWECSFVTDPVSGRWIRATIAIV